MPFAPLPPKEQTLVAFLQYLSACLPQTTGTENYTSVKEVGEYLGIAASDPKLLEIAVYLAERSYIFLDLGAGPGEAVALLTPETWNFKSNQASKFAYFVFNAYGTQKQPRVPPGQRCIIGPAFPFTPGCQTADATLFNGVVTPYKVENFCCDLPSYYPAEFFTPQCFAVSPEFSTTFNYRLLAAYSSMLQALYTGGQGGATFAEIVNTGWSTTSVVLVLGVPNLLWSADVDVARYVALGNFVAGGGKVSGSGTLLSGEAVTVVGNSVTNTDTSETVGACFLGTSVNKALLMQALQVWGPVPP